MRKRTVILLTIMILSCAMASAQNPGMERLNAYKIAFFTKRLNLTPQEAEKFWPVYNELQAQKNQIQLEKASLMRTFNQGESTLSDEQITELGNKYCAAIVKESELAVKYHKIMMELLPPKKVMMLYQVENQYRLQLLNELRDNKPARNNPPQGAVRRQL
jgi:Spy/CpxP family protein refolding chaperone